MPAVIWPNLKDDGGDDDGGDDDGGDDDHGDDVKEVDDDGGGDDNDDDNANDKMKGSSSESPSCSLNLPRWTMESSAMVTRKMKVLKKTRWMVVTLCFGFDLFTT